ncbi:acyltransferase family protein [Sphingomonas crocodyli]|uniref:acyltransferase family protein n=1 Tax=Sphingomonas crocodyli TaxID=1979270 RepID=UPI0013E2A7C6|nr:acyltransferase [Sphingomonas crocodyli]
MERNIQGLRAIAAYMVVVHHILDTFANNLGFHHPINNMRTGGAGVDIFFVISGYIMMLTTSDRPIGPKRFLYNRIIRIVPMYWLLTIVALILIAAGFKMFGQNPIDVKRILTSFGFLPYFGSSGKVIDPILFPGWTLNYEMMFYIVFALCLLRHDVKFRILSVCCILFCFWLAQVYIDDPLVDYLGADVIIGFAAGIMLWRVSRHNIVSPVIAAGFCLLGVLALVMLDYPIPFPIPHARLIVIAGALSIVFGAVCLERHGIKIKDGWLMHEGNASYSLYLIHPFVLQFVAKVAKVMHFGGGYLASFGLAAVMLITSGVAARLLYSKLEQPLSEILKLSRRKANFVRT